MIKIKKGFWKTQFFSWLSILKTGAMLKKFPISIPKKISHYFKNCCKAIKQNKKIYEIKSVKWFSVLKQAKDCTDIAAGNECFLEEKSGKRGILESNLPLTWEPDLLEFLLYAISRTIFCWYAYPLLSELSYL